MEENKVLIGGHKYLWNNTIILAT